MEFSHLICSQATASKWDPWIVWTCPPCLSKSTEVNLKVLFATENTAPQPFNGEHHTYNNQIKCIQSNSTTQKAIPVLNPNKNEKKIFVSSSNVWDVPDVTELRPRAVPRLLWHTVLELYRYKHKKPCTPPHKILVKLDLWSQLNHRLPWFWWPQQCKARRSVWSLRLTQLIWQTHTLTKFYSQCSADSCTWKSSVFLTSTYSSTGKLSKCLISQAPEICFRKNVNLQ